jgi:hypothetical protein
VRDQHQLLGFFSFLFSAFARARRTGGGARTIRRLICKLVKCISLVFRFCPRCCGRLFLFLMTAWGLLLDLVLSCRNYLPFWPLEVASSFNCSTHLQLFLLPQGSRWHVFVFVFFSFQILGGETHQTIRFFA